jgi:hypothetical protein
VLDGDPRVAVTVDVLCFERWRGDKPHERSLQVGGALPKASRAEQAGQRPVFEGESKFERDEQTAGFLVVTIRSEHGEDGTERCDVAVGPANQ